MTGNVNLSTPELATLFGFFQNRNDSVLWIRDSSHKQLYVSPQFEKIWARNSRMLFEEPRSWYDTLLPIDHDDVAQKMQARRGVQNMPFIQEVLFRIHVPGGKIKFIRDFCIRLFDKQGKLKAFAGVGQALKHDEWQQHLESCKKSSQGAKTTPEFQDILSSVISQELSLSASAPLKTSYTIETPYGVLNLAKREAQCLYHLCHGKSAKQTGASLFLSPRTVETYLEALKRKTHSKTKLEILGKINIDLFLTQFDP